MYGKTDFLLVALMAYLSRVTGELSFDVGFSYSDLQNEVKELELFATHVPCRINSWFAHFFLSLRNYQKNIKSIFHNGLSDLPKFTLNYHPALKTLFLWDGANSPQSTFELQVRTLIKSFSFFLTQFKIGEPGVFGQSRDNWKEKALVLYYEVLKASDLFTYHFLACIIVLLIYTIMLGRVILLLFLWNLNYKSCPLAG